jgi:hypothetical protein
MLLEAEYAIWGLDARGYHLTSLILICLSALVLDALVVALLRRCRPEESARHPWRLHASTALAVALFLAHPLRVEVVAWVSCQPYLPSALFAITHSAASAWSAAGCSDGRRGPAGSKKSRISSWPHSSR